jgi:hypothetical protein
MMSFLRGIRGSLVVSLFVTASLSGAFLVACVPAEPSKPGDGSGGSATGGGNGSGGAGGTQSGAGGTTSGGSGGGSAAGGHTGAGGSATGAGGMTTTGAGGQGNVSVGSDPCTSADPGNEDQSHATPYTVLGADFHACMQSATDIDFYEFTTPASPAAGGVITVNLIDVGTNGSIDSTAFAASDNSEIQGNGNGTNGGSAYYWFNAAPATKYRVSVQRFYSGMTANPYTFKATYTQLNDTFEPNDLRTQAAPLTAGTPAQAFMFAGFTSSTGFASNAWEDWYKVTLAAGMVKLTLSILATDIAGDMVLYDALGTEVTSMGSATNGSTVLLNRTGITAGDYYVKVAPFYVPSGKGNGTVLPQYVSQPYTLTITQ